MQRLRVRFLLAILAGDVRASCDVMDAAREEGADADEIVIVIVRPALQEVGLRWAAGELGVAQEHVASATAAIALEHVAELQPVAEGDRPVAVVACVEGELHVLGARVIADALERAGWQTLFCGASTPVDDLAGLASERGARLVALSVARRSELPATSRTIAALRALQSSPYIVVGGQACIRPDDLPDADVVHVGADFRPLLQRLRAVPA
jgi:methanogenic corrinoid protein MtbC1